MNPNLHIANLKPGDRLDKYLLRCQIGAGGFGQVWLADDQNIKDQYAIKILKPDTSLDNRLKEAEIGHALNHDNLVRVHQADVVDIEGQDYVIIAMNYMKNGSITKLANPSHYLKLPDVIRFGRDILRGLEYLHNKDFYHNDVKPQNVLIGPQGQGMLTDYGIVGITRGGAPIKPPDFYRIHQAPEVLIENIITAQTDIYQTGLTLFRILTDLNILRRKFRDKGEQDYYESVIQGNLIDKRDFPDYVPMRLRRIILTAIAPDLDKRYGSALEMRRNLEKINYPGYWTVDSNNQFVGRDNSNYYRYEKNQKDKNVYDVISFQKNIKSGREIRISKFCQNNVSNSQAKKLIQKFIKSVVTGL